MKTLLPSLVTLGTLVALSSCTDRQKDQADAIQENANRQAEAVREKADQTVASVENTAEATADKLREQASGIENRAEDRVDAVQAGAERKADQIEESGEKRADMMKKEYGTQSSLRERETDRDEVKEAQEKLVKLGYLDGRADGMIGPKTRSAVREFQSKEGIAVNGSLDDTTVEHLDKAEDRLAE